MKLLFVRRAHDLLSRCIESKYFLPCCIAVAMLLRVAWVAAIPNRQISDFAKYEALGREIAAGHGYSIDGRPTAYFPIGYPLFLGAVFYLFDGSELAAKLANVLLYLGIIGFTFKLTETLFRSRFIAGLAALMLTFEPNHVAFSSVLLSETLFTFVTLMGAWLLIRWGSRARAVLLAGFVFGIASLVRPLGSALMIVVFAAAWWNHRDLLRRWRIVAVTSALVVGHLLALGPYALRNRAVMHELSFVPLNGGINLVLGNSPYASGTYPTDAEVNRQVRSLIPRSDDEVADNKALTRYATDYIVRHPLATLKLWPMKILYLYAFELDGIHRNLDGLPKGSRLGWLLPVTQAYYSLLAAAFLLAAFLRLRIRDDSSPLRRLPVVGFWIVIAWTFIHMVYLGTSRYHYPMVFWIAMYAAALSNHWMTRRLARDDVRA